MAVSEQSEAGPTVVERSTLQVDEESMAAEFVGRDHGASVSLIMVRTDEIGAGPRLHQHPYDETFVIHQGSAEFVVGDRTLLGRAGQVIVVPAYTPHKFAKIGSERLEMTDIHANDVYITEWLED